MHAVEIPRKTCRLFGVIKAVGLVKNCIVLVHGPKGCVYHINYILGMRGGRPSRIYSTCLDEKDVIFGAEKKLRAAIEELDQAHHPDLIAVLSCCATGIIGEDVASAAQEAKTGARVIAFAAGGFEGDHRSGYAEALLRLVEALAESAGPVDPRVVNLVGVLRGGPDLRELVRILSLIGVRVNAVLTAGATIDDIRRLPAAALNIVLCEPAGTDAAGYMKTRFGIPSISLPLPVGIKSTRQFLEEVAQALDIPIPPGLVPALADIPVPPEPVQDFTDLPAPSGPAPSLTDLPVPTGLTPATPGITRLADQRVAIIGGPTRAISFTRFLQEQGCEPVLVAVDYDSPCLTAFAAQVGPGTALLIEPAEEELERSIRDLGVTLILGGMLERPVADGLGIRSIDIMHGCAETVGIRGATNLHRLLRDEEE